MNAMQDFFRKYDAVPATDAGPDWRNASTQALIGWATGDCEVWDKEPDAQARIIDHMQDVGNELHRRFMAQKVDADGSFASNADWMSRACGAVHAVFQRIGYGRRK